ncbi:translation elongation factor Ts [Rarobacter faecitabidus]|uniref:Elongation factor Ts n=1 Tax=Rarobacter faecitabidus TaxID=13243 RepID=A0A542ZWF6_RARFA|nr:translation elongation factor Ts [Rarobacter faecitabidus]TQL64691.1 translation elongation factor Ts (EF-Ts) [Rarobacter faecitabidus]
MAKINPADIKALRERTGAGLLDVKKALVEAEGDPERAIEIIRVKGLKGVAKREDRSTSEGLVALSVRQSEEVEGEVGTIIELNSETDFVAKSDPFINLAARVLDSIVAAGASNETDALTADADGKTVKEVIDTTAATLGEKVALRRVARVAGERVTSYLHHTAAGLPPSIGVLVATNVAGAAVAKDIAQHVAGLSPQYLSREDVPADVVENERRIVEETARNEGGSKPDHIIAKIAENRLNKFFEDVVLLEQPLAKDPSKTIGQLLKEVGGTLTEFVRFRVGA